MQHCLICNGELSFFQKWKDRWYQTSNKEYEIYKCNKCKTEQILPMPTKEEQFSFYPKTYYSYSWNTIANKKNIMQKIMETVLRSINTILDYKYWNKHKVKKGWFDTFVEWQLSTKKQFSVLDIGCWTNATKKHFWNSWKRSGFEIADEIKHIEDISYAPSIWEVSFEKKFDAIIAIHVVEHIDNPKLFFEKVYDLLSEDWYILIQLPSCEWIFNKILGKYASERDIPRHLFNYSKEWLIQLVQQSNFEVVDCKYLPNYWTWISLFWYIWKLKSNIFYKIIGWILIFLDTIVSFLPVKTNQLWIILKKHA